VSANAQISRPKRNNEDPTAAQHLTSALTATLQRTNLPLSKRSTNMRVKLTFLALAVILNAFAAAQSSRAASDEQAIRSADKEWSQNAKTATLDKFLTFYAEDASVLPFNAPLVTGKENIRQFFTQLFSKPGFSVTFAPTNVQVSKSHDMAYEIGTAQLTLNDAQGQPTTLPAKYVVVWRRDANHDWKAVADMFNTDK
jgi:uncharacterized protein (TIGR02246 family)